MACRIDLDEGRINCIFGALDTGEWQGSYMISMRVNINLRLRCVLTFGVWCCCAFADGMELLTADTIRRSLGKRGIVEDFIFSNFIL